MKKFCYYITDDKLLQKISSLLCFLTIFMGIIDPANKLLGLKNISFLLFVFSSFSFASYKRIDIILIFLSIFFFSAALQHLFPTTEVDFGYQLHTLKGFLYLIILLFVKKNNHIHLFYFFYFSVFVLAIMISTIWALLLLFPALELPFYHYFRSIDCYISYRTFLGIRFTAVNYGVGILAIITLTYSQYKIITGSSKKYFFHSFFFMLCLIISSTRANILASILILGFSLILYLYKKKRLLGVVCISLTGIFVFLLLFFALLSEKTETSMSIKTLHIVSYNELFSSNPMRYLLIGDGPGALFFSKGNGKFVPQTEWSYLDLIRNYGLINTILIVWIFLYSLVNIFNSYNTLFSIMITFGYILFLVVSGTNPYLINSVGFTVLAVFIYMSNNNIENEMRKKICNHKRKTKDFYLIFHS